MFFHDLLSAVSALSVLAQCPVVSLVASCSAVTCPISMQWDQDL